MGIPDITHLSTKNIENIVIKVFLVNLIRISNNSSLSERIMKRIALNIKKILDRSN
jgi:hypothetical protein|tara:strand:- start:915 stop:1082 length:168 start_codon:yes stop_codon:yes gene_type:complete